MAIGNTNLYNLNDNTVVLEDYLKDKKFISKMETTLKETYGLNYKEYLEENVKASKDANKINNLFEKNDKGNEIHPSFYGGIYIDENNDLVLQLVNSEMTEKDLQLYEEILKINENIKIIYVKHSYMELENVNNIINDYYESIDINNTNISGYYIDVINNQIVVELINCTEQEIKNFKEKVIDSPIVVFVEAEKNVPFADILPGAGFVYLNNQCSYGYRAKIGLSNFAGIVTAGHCFYQVGNELSGIGTVRYLQKSGNLDAAFIETNSGVNPSNTLAVTISPGANYLSPSETMTSFTVGTAVGKIGYSTGYTYGTITSTNYTGSGISGQIRTNMGGLGGDSGGIVFQSIRGLKGYKVAGIVQGGENPAPGENIGKNLHFVRADKINSSFRLTRY